MNIFSIFFSQMSIRISENQCPQGIWFTDICHFWNSFSLQQIYMIIHNENPQLIQKVITELYAQIKDAVNPQVSFSLCLYTHNFMHYSYEVHKANT